ncbi:hypothetical protein [Burkholderia pseudomultivorans]|uniref:hypothetical protein n=1 Tax=Burkholderia pseudomultivorans TaxID=1207504 RepID=UPI00188E7177|nr:hypothetical protein [Burkholderia pseudomultivorans]
MKRPDRCTATRERSPVTMRSGSVVRMKRCEILEMIVADATIVGVHANAARHGARRDGGKALAHAAREPVKPARSMRSVRADAQTTTGSGDLAQATRVQAAGRPADAATPLPVRDDARAAPAALSAPIHRPALVIQPHSLFCILLVGELPTDFPDRPVGERRV